jgi:hypothetical protein
MLCYVMLCYVMLCKGKAGLGCGCAFLASFLQYFWLKFLKKGLKLFQ